MVDMIGEGGAAPDGRPDAPPDHEMVPNHAFTNEGKTRFYINSKGGGTPTG